MSRVGQNPLKWIEIEDAPKKITMTTVVHIPELSGFWEKSLDVLKKCIDSLYENTSQPFDLMVIDNGSCAIVKKYLKECQKNGQIQFLTFSNYNLRKLGAMEYLLASAPGEIISFADSDVYFFKGWLDETLNIIDEFPKAGMVSAIPTIDKSQDYYDNTFVGLIQEQDINIEKGSDLIPQTYIDAHRKSIGKTEFSYLRNITKREDTRISRNNVSAYVCGQDFQFTTKKSVINEVLPLNIRSDKEYYDPVYSPVLEAKVNESGYWRLSTNKYLIHHMGNDITNLENEILFLSESKFQNKRSFIKEDKIHRLSFQKQLIQHPVVRKILKWTYSKIYKLLYEH